MKKILLLMAALLAAMTWTGCQDTLEEDVITDPEETAEAGMDAVATLTIEAGKGADTKALALADNGTTATISAFWSEGEQVTVFNLSGSAIGTLTATPKEDNTKATLSGEITISGLSAGQDLTLLFPAETWSYEGQNGKLLNTPAHSDWKSIEKNFDFARATVTIKEITASNITTTSSATFENQQSIYRFGFLHGGYTIPAEKVMITSNQNMLTKSVNAVSGSNTYFTSGEAMTVDLKTTPSAGELIYVAVRNGNTTQDDTFSFTIYDVNGATYKGSKTIPSGKLSSPFVSAKTIPMDRLELLQYSTNVAEAL